MKTTPQGPPVPGPDEHHPSDESRADGSHTSVSELRQHEQRRLWGGVGIGVVAPFLLALGLYALPIVIARIPLNQSPPTIGEWVVGFQERMPEGMSVGAIALALAAVGLTLFLATAVGRTRTDTPHEAARQDVLDTLTAAVTMTGAVLSWLLVPLASWREALPVVDVGAALWCAVLNGALFGLTRQDADKVSRWIQETQGQIRALERLVSNHLTPLGVRPVDGKLPTDWEEREGESRPQGWRRRGWAGFPWLACVFGGASATVVAYAGVFPELWRAALLFLVATTWQAWWFQAAAAVVAGRVRDRWGRWGWVLLPGVVALVALGSLTLLLALRDSPLSWLPRYAALSGSVVLAPALALVVSYQPLAGPHKTRLSPLIVTKIRNEQVLAQRQLDSQRRMWHARQPESHGRQLPTSA